VADLHIGWEVALASQGIHVPSQTPKILEKLSHVVAECKPTRLILLGDVKHTVGKVEMAEWRDVPDFFEELVKQVPSVEVVPGNHDGDLEPLTPRSVKLLEPGGMVLWGEVGLFHGHAWPSPGLLGCRRLVMAHVHPVVTFRDYFNYRMTRPVWVKTQSHGEKLAASMLKHLGLKGTGGAGKALRERFSVEVREDQNFIVIPSFNEFLGGQAVNKDQVGKSGRIGKTGRIGKVTGDLLGPVLRSGSVDVDDAEVYLLDGAYLGRVGHLRSLS